MRDQAEALTCQACGDRIGVYERFRWKTPDGRLLSPGPATPRPGDTPVHEACTGASKAAPGTDEPATGERATG